MREEGGPSRKGQVGFSRRLESCGNRKCWDKGPRRISRVCLLSLAYMLNGRPDPNQLFSERERQGTTLRVMIPRQRDLFILQIFTDSTMVDTGEKTVEWKMALSQALQPSTDAGFTFKSIV